MHSSSTPPHVGQTLACMGMRNMVSMAIVNNGAMFRNITIVPSELYCIATIEETWPWGVQGLCASNNGRMAFGRGDGARALQRRAWGQIVPIGGRPSASRCAHYWAA